MTRKGRTPGRGIPERRLLRQREGKRLMIIVGQGRQTEPNYFHGLKQEDVVREKWAVTVKKGTGKSPQEAVKQAIQAIQKEKREGNWLEGDEAWCLLDVEGEENRAALSEAIELAKVNGITVCLSNPCFEVWLLAHFVKTSPRFLDASAVVEKLDSRWQKAFKQPYEKNAQDIFARLRGSKGHKDRKDRLPDAMANAEWVWHYHCDSSSPPSDVPPNPSTEVFRLVRRLLGQG